MSALGRLVVSLGLDIAQFTSGITKAEYDAKKLAAAIQKNFERAVKAAAVGTVGLLAVVDRVAESIATFQGVADKIGDSAEAVASLKTAADLSGTAFASISSASVRLTATLAKTDDESRKTAAALRAIGLSIEDFRRLSPTQQLESVANALAKFEAGAGKTAVAVQLFGNAGADLIPFLNDLADLGGRNVTLTNEQIAAADAYTKKLAALKSEFSTFSQQLIADVIPSMTSVLQRLQDWSKAGPVAWLTTSGADERDPGPAINETIAALDRLKKARADLDPSKSFANRINDSLFGDVADLDKQISVQEKRLAHLRQIQLRQALENGASYDERRFRGGPAAVLDFRIDEKDKPAKRTDPDAEAKRYLENLERAQLRLDKLNETQTLLREIESGRLTVANEQLREQLLAAATLNDLTTESQEIEKQRAEQQKKLEEEIRAIRELGIGPLERAAKQTDRINELLEQQKISEEEAAAAINATWDKTLKAGEDRIEQLSEFAQEARRSMQNILGDALGDAVLGRFEGGIRGLLRRWSEAMALMAAQAAAARIMEAAFGGASGGGGGWGAALGAIFGGGRATGGPVSAGTTYLVGERGPELLTMGTTPGHITPISPASPGAIEINTVVNVTESGSTSQRNGNGGDATALASTIQQLVTAAVTREMQQGGVIWKRQMGYG